MRPAFISQYRIYMLIGSAAKRSYEYTPRKLEKPSGI
jgi:hypothetical protein